MPGIEDRVDAFPEPWKPQAGDKIVGRITNLSTREGFNPGELYPLVELVDDQGREWVVHAFHAVLKNELARQRPVVGDRIAIRYFGRSEKGYERYRCLLEKEQPAGGVDWDAMATSTEAGYDSVEAAGEKEQHAKDATG